MILLAGICIVLEKAKLNAETTLKSVHLWKCKFQHHCLIIFKIYADIRHNAFEWTFFMLKEANEKERLQTLNTDLMLFPLKIIFIPKAMNTSVLKLWLWSSHCGAAVNESD